MSTHDTGTSLAGLVVTHRRYIPFSHAHYAGDLVDGAYVLGLFGDVATELCIRTDGDEGLFASYSDVQFRAPVQAGDVVEVDATLTRVGTRSRTVDFVARVVCRGDGRGRSERLGGRRPGPAAGRGDGHRDRRRARGGLTRTTAPDVNGPFGRCRMACRAQHAEPFAGQRKLVIRVDPPLTCDDAEQCRSGAG